MIRRSIAALAVTVGATAAVSIGPLPVRAAPVTASTAALCPAVPAPVTEQQADRAWSIAADRLAQLTGPRSLPFGATGGSPVVRTGPSSWTSGFFPTALWLMYEHTGSASWLRRARTYTALVEGMARVRWNHDLGFMVGTPTALGASLDPDEVRRGAYRRVHDTAARSLSTRWNPAVRALQSSTYSGRWGLIIDSAMNAPLLIEAGQEMASAAGRRLVARGVAHVRTLADTYVRANGSTLHRGAFDPRSGRFLGPIAGQGRSTSSTWSRGQAWAINGFGRAFALTDDPVLLDAARRTADYWVSRVPAGCVPAWDLSIRDPRAPLDSSAAAIAADGLLRLAAVEPDPARASTYRNYALTTLGTLVSPPFVTDGGRGLLLRQAYSIPIDPREGTYAWGDAYLLVALTAAFPNGRSQRSTISRAS
ncbi:MAG: hypothetical protein GC156_10565 [Actinomycetales bacterium]|nr:hypothetical protein [Actinomycetales bacterium]